MRNRTQSAVVSIAFAAALAGPASAQSVRVPGFKPSSSGLHFVNSFPVMPLITIDILGNNVPIGDASNGLCGGMVYTTRDYYEAGALPPPIESSTEAASMPPLFNYLVARLFDSFNLPGGPLTYLHLMNPDVPDHETDFSRIGLAPHGRAWVMIVEQWPGIRADLDGGRVSPMALVRIKSHDPFQMGENHQVLAYGYDLNGSALTIYVYDPNHPHQDDVTVSLSIADPQHTTDVTQSTGEAVICFFRTGYAFTSPPAIGCSSTEVNIRRSLATGYSDRNAKPIQNGLADDNYQLFEPGAPSLCATVVPDDDYPIGAWIGSSANSKWIGPRRRNSVGAPGSYTFRTQVNLTAGDDPASLEILGSWAADDVLVDVQVNGVSLGISGPGNFNTLTPFPLGAGKGSFRAGENTVDFVVANGGADLNPVGLRVEAVLGVPPSPDLVIHSFGVSVASATAGDSIEVDDITANTGSLASAASCSTRFYLSGDASVGAGDTLLGERPVPALLPGNGSASLTQLTLPAGLRTGTYFIGACADASGVIPESNEGNNCSPGRAIQVTGLPPTELPCFRDEFDEFSRRGVPGWSEREGRWAVSEGQLLTSSEGSEAWIWAGKPPVVAGERASYSIELTISDLGESHVGRHAGVMFCAATPTTRGDVRNLGYTLDWIDVSQGGDSRGLRLIRWDQGAAFVLAFGGHDLDDPPRAWQIEVDGEGIRCLGDGKLLIESADATYRGGHFGIWTWLSQTLAVERVAFGASCGGRMLPGDASPDGSTDVSDPVRLLGHLYQGDPLRLPCGDGSVGHPANIALLDFNGDGGVDLSDAVAMLVRQFQGGAPHVAGEKCMTIEGCPDFSFSVCGR